MGIKESISELRQKFDADLSEVRDSESIEKLRVSYLGKKGSVTELLKGLKDLSGAEKKEFGQTINTLKREVDERITAHVERIRQEEKRCDHYEDVLGTYLVKLSTQQMGAAESEEATELLKTIGDFERISDHAVNVLESAEELRAKGLTFSRAAQSELDVLSRAVRDILQLALRAFREKDTTAAGQVEPLEQVIDALKEQMRTRHILRMRQGQCSIETGFVWCDLLTDLERTSDHCSNIAGCVIDAAQHNLNLHETLHNMHHSDGEYRRQFDACAEIYRLPPPEQA